MRRRLTFFLLLSSVRCLAASQGSPVAHLGAANRLLEQERFVEAAAEYQRALDDDPQLLAARRDLAVCRFELRQYEAAGKLLTELLNHQTTRAVALYYLGRIDLVQGNFPAAIKRFLALGAEHPFRDEHYFLGMAYFKSGAWKASVEFLQASIRENPRDFRSHQLLARALQKLGRTDAAAQEFSETRRLLGYYTEGSQAVKRCGQLLTAHRDGEAAEVCGPLLESDDVDKLAALGLLLGNSGQFKEAETAWKRAALLDPDSSETRYDLALTCFHLKDSACARENARAAIEGRPEFPEANVLYASILYMQGADELALPALRRAHALSPEDPSIRRLLGNELVLWAEQSLKTGKPREARLLLTDLDTLRPLSSEQEERRIALNKRLDEDAR